MKFSFEPVAGRRQLGGKWVDVNLPRRNVLLDGVVIGFIGTQPGSELNLVRHVGKDIEDAVRNFVASDVGGDAETTIRVNVPPELTDEDRDLMDQIGGVA